MAQERLHWTDDGQVRLELRRPWADGTTQLLFDPVELLERLAALTPRPRINLILYYGVLAPRAAWRALVVQFGAGGSPAATEAEDDAPEHPDAADRHHDSNYLWAELMRVKYRLPAGHRPSRGRNEPIAILTMLGAIASIVVWARPTQSMSSPQSTPRVPRPC